MNSLLVVHILFYVFATLAVLSALVVVTVRNPVRSVLALVVTFFAMAGVWMLLAAEFLSLILLLVYVGAVMTLFLFCGDDAKCRCHLASRRFYPLLTFWHSFSFYGQLVLPLSVLARISPNCHRLLPYTAEYSNVNALGAVLYTQYAYPFEIAGVLLLAAIVAAISLAQRTPRQRKAQNIDKQLSVRRQDRITLVKMQSEKKNDLS